MKSLEQITDNDAIVVKENGIRYIIIPVWEYDVDATNQIQIHSELIADHFNRILFNLECEYPIDVLPKKLQID